MCRHLVADEKQKTISNTLLNRNSFIDELYDEVPQDLEGGDNIISLILLSDTFHPVRNRRSVVKFADPESLPSCKSQSDSYSQTNSAKLSKAIYESASERMIGSDGKIDKIPLGYANQQYYYRNQNIKTIDSRFSNADLKERRKRLLPLPSFSSIGQSRIETHSISIFDT